MVDRQQQSAKSAEDSRLILYRLEKVEAAVSEVGLKIERQDNIKRTDLLEFRDTIVDRVNEMKTDLQKQLDGKADQSQVDDLRTLIKAVGSILGSIIAGLALYFLTTK